MSSVGSTVSIDRIYLDTLIRRAQFNPKNNGFSPSHPTITISRAEYDTLLKNAREFANLRQNLMRGGVTEDTLAVLTSNESTWEDAESTTTTDPRPVAQDGTQRTHHPQQHRAPAAHSSRVGLHQKQPAFQQPVKQEWAEEVQDASDAGYSPVDASRQKGAELQGAAQGPPRPQYERVADRTIVIANLAEGTTHADVTAVVRGGLLLEIFMRRHDRSVQISFLQSENAREFFDHVRRHDLYIKNKRVEVRWSDRQFSLPGHVASKIGIGATRNLVVRRCDPNLTEEGIRDDLEHIHNLVVVQVSFRGGSCYISTNSVNNAMFARTCMMSRFKYKGAKIEWDVDECAQPLEKPQHYQTPPQTLSSRRGMNPMANRFQLLDVDRGDNSQESMSQGFCQRVPLDIMV